MDDFSLERPELSGSLMSIEFGAGGRMQQLWEADPRSPDDEEFQFILSPLTFGEEFAEDYYPGTILIGARTNPTEPWALSRNANAEAIEADEDPGSVAFQYDFPLLPELDVTGRFFEIPGPIPQIVWDLRIENTSRTSVEIGELAFPFALNNLLEGFPQTRAGLEKLANDRVLIHKYIGGAASYLFAQRLNAEPPGLVIYPGDETAWEFYNHVPASLNSPYRWEGIPVVYVYSRAAIEREGWPEWFGEHTTLVMEPGDVRRVQTRFAPADRWAEDHVHSTLASAKRPSIRLVPSAVAPASVGIGVEVAGATPAQFFADGEADLESDADEEGGFCFVKPKEPGPMVVSMIDTQDRRSAAHLLFTEPIDELIRKRAEWIVEHQTIQDPASPLYRAILPADIASGSPLTDIDDYLTSFGVESSLADALFLAEKNVRYPVKAQIEILDHYLDHFIGGYVQNPGSGVVCHSFVDFDSVATNGGRAETYLLVLALNAAMARCANTYGETRRDAAAYLAAASKTARAMFDHANMNPYGGTALMPELRLLLDAMREAGIEDPPSWQRDLHLREEHLNRIRYPVGGASPWRAEGLAEAVEAAGFRFDDEHAHQIAKCASAARSLAPSWWWQGSDKRFLEEEETPAMADKGEACLGPSTALNSRIFLDQFVKDHANPSDLATRQAFSGLMGVWALVRPDGAAASGFCPDAASNQFGMSPVTGDVGVALYGYLRSVAAYVLPSRNAGISTFGCHVDSVTEAGATTYTVTPWDGVGARIVVANLGVYASVDFGVIRNMKFDSKKRSARIDLFNPADKPMRSNVSVNGLWGTRFEVNGVDYEFDNGNLYAAIDLPKHGALTVDVRVRP